jgi:D-amino-acid dehydrogenase
MPITKKFSAPKNTITDPENKIVYSNIGDQFRVAGTFEISPIDYKINQNNIDFLKRTMKSSFINFGDIEKAELWQGYRPHSSEIMPICQQSNEYKNLYINSGHGSLGWTMCFATSKRISKIISS